MVASFDGSDTLAWTFIGSLHLADTDELIGPPSDDRNTYVLGPKVEQPA